MCVVWSDLSRRPRCRWCVAGAPSSSSLIGSDFILPNHFLITAVGAPTKTTEDLGSTPLTALRVLVARLWDGRAIGGLAIHRPPTSRKARVSGADGACLFDIL